MTSIKNTIIFLTSLLVVGLVFNLMTNTRAWAQPTGGMYCVSSYEELIVETKKREQPLAFVGITRTGVALWFFASPEAFSVFFKDRMTGKYCTSPKYWGKVINTMPMEDYLNSERK